MEDIDILGVITEQVGTPRADGTRGSGLYAIPIQLSARPSPIWARLFIRNWDHPPRSSSMHRPGIASISGDVLWLNGTTVEELRDVHAETLRLVVELTNKEAAAIAAKDSDLSRRERDRKESHKEHVEEVSRRINFG